MCPEIFNIAKNNIGTLVTDHLFGKICRLDREAKRNKVEIEKKN